MADNFGMCPIEFLSEIGGIWTYRCEVCQGQCPSEDRTDDHAHMIDFNCEHCGGPSGGCTDGFPPLAVAIDMQQNAIKCTHGEKPLPNGPISARTVLRCGPDVDSETVGVASYRHNGQTKRARLFKVKKGKTRYFGAETTAAATLPEYTLRGTNGYCHHLQRGSGPIFHVFTAGGRSKGNPQSKARPRSKKRK